MFNHFTQSHAYIRQRNGAEERISSFKMTKCFIVLPTGGRSAKHKYAGRILECIKPKMCSAAVLLLCLEHVRTDRVGTMSCKVYTCYRSKALTLSSQKQVELYNPVQPLLEEQRAQYEAHRDKVQHNMFSVGERWPHRIRQDWPLRNTSPPPSSSFSFKLMDTLLKG